MIKSFIYDKIFMSSSCLSVNSSSNFVRSRWSYWERKSCFSSLETTKSNVTFESLQVTVLLKECQDIQVRCGSFGNNINANATNISSRTNTATDAESIISQHLVSFMG